MKAKCKHCGDIIEVTRLREFKSCKCGAIALDYGDPPYYYRVIGNPENFDGEIEDVPKTHNGDIVIEHLHPEQTETIISYNKPHEKKIVPVMWGNSTDRSTCGIVFVDNGYSKRLFFGSRKNYTNEDDDARHIANWGNEITKADLEQLLKMIGE